VLALAWSAFCALPAWATDRKTDLKEQQSDLRGRIAALQQEIDRAEGSRADASEELRETGRAISQANRRLHELGAERSRLRAALAELEAQARRLGGRIGGQQEQLGQLLARQYRAGEADALRHLLAGEDPNQTAREAHYLGLISRAQAQLIQALGQSLEEKQRLAERARHSHAELAQLEDREHRARAELLEQQGKHQAVLARIAGRIKAQRREVEKLKRDEKRLARLIEGLGRIVARPTRAARAPALHNERLPEPAAATQSLARLRGRLSLPVRGELANRFGAPRDEGGTRWKGIFIRAPAAGEVRAIAAGRVVFADWLRGFGNLAIVDHGEGYLSVYGNNEALLKEVGQAVHAGEAIASVGASGGTAETGLYLELRHLGEAQDPLKWVRLR
jgi:septal ring factor EnvC (AmiA/AmiB activator)